MPKVSVIMTVFNEARHIAEAIASVRAQEFDDFEMVIVDDGSTDATGEILSGIDDSRIHVGGGPRLGRQRALNEAVRQSSGEYVAILDADDLSLPDRIRVSSEYLDRHPRVGLVGSRYRVFIDDCGEPAGLEKEQACSNATIRRALCDRNPIFHSSVMYRRAVFDEIGGYDTRLACLEDWDLWVRMSRTCQLVNLDARLSCKRRHAGQFYDGTTGGHRTASAQRALARIMWRTVRELDGPKRNLLRAARWLALSLFGDDKQP